MSIITFVRSEYPGLSVSPCLTIDLSHVVEVSKSSKGSWFYINLKTERGPFLRLEFSPFVYDDITEDVAKNSRDRACDKILKALNGGAETVSPNSSQLSSANPGLTETPDRVETITPEIVSVKPSKSMNDNNSSILNTVLTDTKSFIKENRNIIYTVVAVILIDKFVLGGKLTERIKSLVEKFLGSAEKKVASITGEPAKE